MLLAVGVTPAGRVRHPVEIALEGVKIEDERRRFNGSNGVAGPCGRTLGA